MLRAETLRWFAEQLSAQRGREVTVDEVERGVQRALAAQAERDFAPSAEGVDLNRCLREIDPVGPEAGAVVKRKGLRLTLVVSLPSVRVWVARGDEWERASRRADRAPVLWQVLGTAPGEPAPRWHDVAPSEVPAELEAEVGRAVWARHVQKAAA